MKKRKEKKLKYRRTKKNAEKKDRRKNTINILIQHKKYKNDKKNIKNAEKFRGFLSLSDQFV
jgi:hypothetical protein